MPTSIPPRRLTAAETASVTGQKLVDNINEAVRRLASPEPRNVADVRSMLALLANRLGQLQAFHDPAGSQSDGTEVTR
jgi:hypothetical protein